MKSEYLGIRIAMHDALQRYYAQGGAEAPEQQVAALQQLIRQACHENKLLGDRRDVIGAAWAQFLGTRNPDAVAAFLANSEVQRYSKATTPMLKGLVPTMGWSGAVQHLFKARNFAFETIAQQTGLIDYEKGESLSAHLRAAERVVAPAARPQTPEGSWIVRQIHALFDSNYGRVKPQDMGNTRHMLALGH